MRSERSDAIRRKLMGLAGGAGVTAASLAGGTAAYASITYFNNESLTFDWAIETNLDITLGPGNQGSADPESSFYQFELYNPFMHKTYWDFRGTTDPPDRFANQGRKSLTVFAADEVIGSSKIFDPEFPLGAAYDNGSSTWSYYVGDGVREFTGVRFEDAGGDLHYGWIDVQWNPTDDRFDAYAWAYEEVADRGIEAGRTTGTLPEPGTLAMFAVGATALAAARRRRKKEDA